MEQASSTEVVNSARTGLGDKVLAFDGSLLASILLLHRGEFLRVVGLQEVDEWNKVVEVTHVVGLRDLALVLLDPLLVADFLDLQEEVDALIFLYDELAELDVQVEDLPDALSVELGIEILHLVLGNVGHVVLFAAEEF